MLSDVVILAAGNYWESVARYLNRTNTYRENMLFLAFAAAIAAIWIALLLWERRRIAQPTLPPLSHSVFEELCQSHRLEPQDVTLLVAAAQECRLTGPAFLFVQPECLERLSGEGLPQAEVYGRLRERLFGNL